MSFGICGLGSKSSFPVHKVPPSNLPSADLDRVCGKNAAHLRRLALRSASRWLGGNKPVPKLPPGGIIARAQRGFTSKNDRFATYFARPRQTALTLHHFCMSLSPIKRGLIVRDLILEIEEPVECSLLETQRSEDIAGSPIHCIGDESLIGDE